MADNQNQDIGATLIELLSQQHRLYRQLYELAQQQSDLVSGDNPEMLLRILAARQRIIDRLTDINRRLEPIRVEWNRIAAALPPAKREEIQRLVDGVQEILANIIDRDEKDSKNLSRKKQTVSTELRNASQSKKMNQAYAQVARPAKSRFVDTKTS